LRKTLLAVLFAAAAYTAVIILSDAEQVWRAVASISPMWIPVFLALALFNYFLRFLKWQYFLRRVDVHIPAGRSAAVFAAGFSMTVTPGKLGELVKSYILRRLDGIPVRVTSPVVIAERVTDLISMVFIACFGLFMVENGSVLPAVGAGAVMVAAAMYILLASRPFNFIVDRLCRFRKFSSHREGFLTFQRSCRSLLDTGSLLVSVPLGILSWGCEALILVAAGRALGVSPPVTLGLALLAHSAGTIAGAVSMIPGGLGLTEITIGAVLVSAMPEADAVVATLLMRFATIWFAVALGMATLGVLRRRYVGIGLMVRGEE